MTKEAASILKGREWMVVGAYYSYCDGEGVCVCVFVSTIILLLLNSRLVVVVRIERC